jgi:hypothetical protein
MFAEDAGTFLADFGSATTWAPSLGGAAVSGLVLFDQADEVIGDGQAQGAQYQVTFETAAWPGLKRGETLVIQGEGKGGSYRLRFDPRAQADGVFSAVGVSRVA